MASPVSSIHQKDQSTDLGSEFNSPSYPPQLTFEGPYPPSEVSCLLDTMFTKAVFFAMETATECLKCT